VWREQYQVNVFLNCFGLVFRFWSIAIEFGDCQLTKECQRNLSTYGVYEKCLLSFSEAIVNLDVIKDEISTNMSSIVSRGTKAIYMGWDPERWRLMLREMMDDLEDQTTLLEILWEEFGSRNMREDFHEFLQFLDWERVNLYKILENSEKFTRRSTKCHPHPRRMAINRVSKNENDHRGEIHI
jgi:hypothetical protein